MEVTLQLDPRISLNKSLQVGDTVWYVQPSNAGGYSIAETDNVMKLGTVEFINNQYRQATIKVSVYTLDPYFNPYIDENTFIMFSKNNKANLSDLTGYFAKAKFINNSIKKVELFAVGSEITESSK